MNAWRYFCSGLILFVLTQGGALAADIHEAAKAGDLDRLEKILAGDPSRVDSFDEDRVAPLHHAIQAGHLEAAAMLIRSGADIDLANDKKETPLHIAAYQGNSAAVRLLLKNGADFTLRDMRDRIPLFLAGNWGNDLETVRLLIDAGSDVNDRNSRGEIVLVSSLYRGKKEIIDLLIDRGATIPEDEGTLHRVLSVTASNGLDRPFKMAVEKCEEKQIRWWIGVGMDECARGGSVDIARALLAKGAGFKQMNRYGVTPLHIAAENGRIEMVEFLLSKGAEIDTPSLAGQTAFHFARDNGHSELAALLAGKGASQEGPHFPALEGDYLGQEAPGETPRIFAPGIVSSHGFDSEHSPAVFSPDLGEVYWTRKFRGPILFMKREGKRWTAPRPAPFSSEFGDGEPMFSPDGRRLFFLSFRPLKPGGATDKENMWFVERTPAGWSNPKPVSPLINAYDLHWLFSIAASGAVYFASPGEGGLGSNDIYSSRLVNGRYQEPENLGSVINTPGIDHTPYIAPDESYLIYVSSGASPSPADMKFRISYREKDGSWGEPIELGRNLDSLDFALCPAVTPDGRFLFFIAEGDIYWVDAGFIEELRPGKNLPPPADLHPSREGSPGFSGPDPRASCRT